MKKLITLLLVLALLVPMCLVANADAAKKNFYGVTWSNDIEGFSYVENLYTISIGMLGGNVKLGSLTYGVYTDAQVTAMAEKMKKDLNARDAGERYIHFFGPKNAMDLVENVVYMDEVTKQLSEMTTALFAKYKEIGGEVDGAMMSMLYTGLGAYYIDAKDYNKIVKDSRYQTQIRPLLAERGFVFYENPTAQTPEIYGISGNAGSKYANCQAIWNTVMNIRLSTSIAQWAYEPMAKYFPDVHVADYQSTDTDAWMKPVNSDGNVMGSGGNNLRAGNTSCEKFYSNTPTNDDFYGKVGTSYKSIPTYMSATYKKTAFNNFRYDTNVAKQVYTADANNDVCFWIGKYSTAADNNTQIANTPYYAEQLYHLCLYDPKPFVVFINTEEVTGDALKTAAGIADKLLAEVSRVAGYADREPIATPVDWNSEFVISGMYANGKNIWRITPNRDLTTKEAFKVAGSDPTFSVNGQTVTFPGGKIITENVVSEVGSLGYWVETPKNVTPVITSDADRFEKYPAYTENFDSYAADTKLQSSNVRDLNAWIINPKGSDLLITKDKALSVTGNSLLQNQNVPANLTVGDEYAKKQSWEVTITIPEGLNKDAQMVLLNYEAKGTEIDDGGFKLLGNKLYYAIGEEDADYEPVYKELMDVKAGTYTLKRDLYFGQNYLCDYTVTDASGKVLKTAEKVSIPAFSGKVTSIGITCENVNKRVLLDDYTLRVTSAAADLYLYDTALGTKVEDGAKRTASTTYRLSWANASGKSETATVKAEIIQSGKTTVKTLKTVTMKPGCDGVEYGTVDVKSGQNVKIYLETSIKDETAELPATEPTEAPTEATKEATKTTTKATIPPFSRPSRATKATTATKVTKATKATEESVVTEATVLTEATEVTVVTEATEVTAATEATEATTPVTGGKKVSTNIAIIVVIGVVVLAAAAVGATWFFLRKKTPAEVTEAAEAVETAEATETAEEPETPAEKPEE